MKMNILLLSTALCLISVRGEEWGGHTVLDPDQKYHLWWTISDEDVTFQVEVETRGWIGFGISPTGEMTGSDVVIGWIADYRSGFHDRYAADRSLPIIDDHQDWEFLWCSENDTHTALRFKRSFDTCDIQDIPIIRDQTTRLIYAYNDEDPTSSATIMYHGGNRGTKSVLLSQRSKRSLPDGSKDIQFWDVTSANVLLPRNKDTVYYCTMFIRPKLDKKHHVIRIEPIIKKGNEEFIHHMILYKCSHVPKNVIYPFRLKEYTECYADDLTTNFPFCQHAWAGWAVGGQVFEFPDHAGMPLEEGYYRLEVHYDNPQLKRGKTIIIRHFRGDEELPPIASDENFDFNYQEHRLLSKERTVLPDDHLIVECTYDSSQRNQTTFGGLGTRQEMCLAFLAYYPKSSMESSISCPSPKKVLKAIGVNETSRNDQYVASPMTGRNETYIDFLNNYPWETNSLNTIQYAIRYGSHIVICATGGNITVTSTNSTYPRVKRAYSQKQSLCDIRPSTDRPRPQEPLITRPPTLPPRQTTPRPVVSQTLPTDPPKRKKKIPQTIPYEILDRIIAELG